MPFSLTTLAFVFVTTMRKQQAALSKVLSQVLLAVESAFDNLPILTDCGVFVLTC